MYTRTNKSPHSLPHILFYRLVTRGAASNKKIEALQAQIELLFCLFSLFEAVQVVTDWHQSSLLAVV